MRMLGLGSKQAHCRGLVLPARCLGFYLEGLGEQ